MNLIMNPYQLLKKMANKPIMYGWYDYVNKKIITPNDKEFDIEGYFDKNCRVLKPLEVWRTGVETCWGTTLLEWFELKRMGLNPRAFYIEGNDATHSAVYYEDEGKIFWFEYSWNVYRGIHGPYNNVDRFFEILLQQHIANQKTYKTVKFLNKSFNVEALVNLNTDIKSNDFINIAKKAY